MKASELISRHNGYVQTIDSDTLLLYRGIFVSLKETEVSLSFFNNFKNIYVLWQEKRKHQSRYSSS